MVIVAQSVEHRVVVPGVAGSSPVGHPKRAPVAQRIEQRTSDPKVVGSSPTRRTINNLSAISSAGRAHDF